MDKFKICVELYKLGFPQSRKDGSLYYVTPKLKIKAENVVYLEQDKQFANFSELIYEPSLEKLLEASASHFVQIITTLQSGVFAYSNIQLPTDGSTDPFMRAGSNLIGEKPTGVLSDDVWFALANLWIAVKEKETKTLSPDEVENSENKSDTLNVPN